jgi:TP901 family phage tail tape measure protein
MAFNAGAILGKAILDDKAWKTGTQGILSSNSLLGKSFGGVSKGVAAVGAAVVAGLSASVVKANEFNKAFSNVRTLVDEAKVNTSAMRKELLSLDARLGSAKDLTEGLYQSLSAGVAPAKAVEFVGESAKFARAALVDTNTAVDVITTGLNAYGLEASKAGKISDILFQTIKQGKTTGAELSATIGQVIPTAAKMSVGFEELGASIATMTKQGINSAEATTQLNALFTAFLKPSEDMKQAFEEMGIASGSALIEAEGLTGALKFLEEATGGNAEKMAEFLPNVRAFKGALALTGDQAEVYNEILGEMENATGSTDTAFQKQELTFETLGNQIGKVAIMVGDRLLPKIYEITTSFTSFITKSENLNKIMGSLEIGITLFNDAWQLIKDSTLSIIDNVKKSIEDAFGADTINNIEILSGAVQLLAIVFKIVVDAINLVITGLINLTKAILDSGKTISSFFDFLQKKTPWEEVKKNAKSAGEAFKDFGVGIAEDSKELVSNAIDEFKDLPSEVGKTAEKLRKSWAKGVKSQGGLKEPIMKELDQTKTEVQNKVGDISGLSLSKMEIWKSKMADIWKKWKEEGSENFSSMASEILGKIQFIASQTASIYQSVFDVAVGFQENELALMKSANQEKISKLEDEKEARLEQADEEAQREIEIQQWKVEVGTLTEEEAAENISLIEEEREARKAQIQEESDKKIEDQKKKNRAKENAKEKEIFEAKKANQIANIWIQSALGIVAAWAQSIAQLGPIAGSIFAGVLTAAILGVSIASTVLVSQQQFVPAKQEGGMAGGRTRVNEVGGEIITLPDGSQVIPNDISQQIAANSGRGQTVVNVSFRGANISDNMSLRKVTDYVSNELARRLELT